MIIISIVILLYFMQSNIEGFSNKHEKVNTLLNNENILRSNYTASRKQIEWLDPVIYNDVKILLNENRFSRDNLINVV